MFLNKTDMIFCLGISFWFSKQFLGSLNNQFQIPKELQIRFHQTHLFVVHPCTSRDPLSKDMLHCVHQGVAPLAISSLITHHFKDLDGSLTIAGLDTALASQAWPHYQHWKNDRWRQQVRNFLPKNLVDLLGSSILNLLAATRVLWWSIWFFGHLHF